MRAIVRLNGYLWRPLTDAEEDTEFILRVRNSPAAQAAFFTPRLTRDDHLCFLRRAEARGEVNWIVDKAGEPVGTAGIYGIDRRNRRGLTRTAVTLPEVHLLNFIVAAQVAFDVLGLHKMWGEALASNDVSNRALERLGAVKEGLLREHVFIDGTFRDVSCYGMLASEWRRNRAGLVARFGEPEVRVDPDEEAC